MSKWIYSGEAVSLGDRDDYDLEALIEEAMSGNVPESVKEEQTKTDGDIDMSLQEYNTLADFIEGMPTIADLGDQTVPFSEFTTATASVMHDAADVSLNYYLDIIADSIPMPEEDVVTSWMRDVPASAEPLLDTTMFIGAASDADGDTDMG